MPAVILCKFDQYNGPGVGPEKDLVPIVPMTNSWTTKDGTNCTRVMFPLCLCYASTIHKSQGLALNKVRQFTNYHKFIIYYALY